MMFNPLPQRSITSVTSVDQDQIAQTDQKLHSLLFNQKFFGKFNSKQSRS
jgi:hypothetical protein